MSTIRKLDPTVRQRRTERKNTRREFERLTDFRTEVGRLCGKVADIFEQVRNDSSADGNRKHRFTARVLAWFDKLLAETPKPWGAALGAICH